MAKYQLEEIVAQAEEAVGGTDVEFDFNGQSWSFPNPLFCGDKWSEEFQTLTGQEEVARFLLGDEQFDKFIAAGGNSNHVTLLLGQASRDTAAAMQDGSPTRSGTSSGATRRPRKRR